MLAQPALELSILHQRQVAFHLGDISKRYDESITDLML